MIPQTRQSTPSRIDGRVSSNGSDLRKRAISAVSVLVGADAAVRRARSRRRRGLHAIHRLAVAGGAGRRRLARDFRCRDARPRARLQTARSDPARAARRPARRRRPSSCRCRRITSRKPPSRGWRREGQQADAEASRRARSDRAAVRRAGHDRAGDLGPRDRLRPLFAALRHAARGGDAGLCRPPQGSVPRRIHPWR